MNRASLLQSKPVQSSQCHLGGQPGAAPVALREQDTPDTPQTEPTLSTRAKQLDWNLRAKASSAHPLTQRTAWLHRKRASHKELHSTSGALGHAEMNTSLHFAYFCQIKSFIWKTVITFVWRPLTVNTVLKLHVRLWNVQLQTPFGGALKKTRSTLATGGVLSKTYLILYYFHYLFLPN